MKKINNYIDNLYEKDDEILSEVIASIKENDMPSISVSSSAGKLLTMLVKISGAKDILEIGALGGYSGICLARGFGDKGRLISLELKEKYAELAQRNLMKAGFGDQVQYMTGEALKNLESLIEQEEMFDFFLIDADKDNYKNYLESCIRLARPGAIIVMDNVLARGSVADKDIPAKRYTELMKVFNDKVANDKRLESFIIPVGDGMTIARVKEQ